MSDNSDDLSLVYAATFGRQPTAVDGRRYASYGWPDNEVFSLEIRQPCGAAIIVYDHDIDTLVQALLEAQQGLRRARG